MGQTAGKTFRVTPAGENHMILPVLGDSKLCYWLEKDPDEMEERGGNMKHETYLAPARIEGASPDGLCSHHDLPLLAS